MAYLDIGYCCVQCGSFLIIDKRESKNQGQLILLCMICGTGNQFECFECGYPTIGRLSKDGVCELCNSEYEEADIQTALIYLGGQEN